MTSPITIYIDADACPVKDEAVRVADRHGLVIHFVSNSYMRLPDGANVNRVIVEAGPDAADDWIADRVTPRDIVVTQDIPLASRCLAVGAKVIGVNGKPFSNASIGMSLAMRELNQHLRETGESRGFNAAFTKRNRSDFLQAMEQAVQETLR